MGTDEPHLVRLSSLCFCIQRVQNLHEVSIEVVATALNSRVTYKDMTSENKSSVLL